MQQIMNKYPDHKLMQQVASRVILSVLFVGLLLFLPAGTLMFWNGWLFMAALFVPMLLAMIWLFKNDQELLKKRIKTREKEKPQKVYLFLSIIWIFLTFILPGLDFRFGWSQVPVWLVILATLVMWTGYYLFFTVMRQNSYASRVIEIQEGQKLIDTGLYGVVRHPMYFAASVMYFAMPLILGSFYAFIPVIFLPLLLVIRILNEEKVLKANLTGYEDYAKKVRFRLIPGVW